MSSPPLTPQRLAAARRGRSAHIVSFLRCVSANPGEVIWIFEGKDVKYYGAKISSLLGVRPKAVVVAGGKSKALELLEYAESNDDLSSVRYACLVDRDFDLEHPTSDRLYITPCYSIENLYATPTAFESVLQGCFDLHSHEHEREIRRLSRLFIKWRTRFCEGIRHLNAWIYLQKANPSYALNLNSVSLDKLVSATWTAGDLSFTRRYSLNGLRTLFPSSAKITARELAAEVRERFHRGMSCELLRGKYMAEFMYTVITKLVQDARTPSPTVFRAKRTVTLQVSKVNFVSDLCAYADTPPCLRDFLRKYA